MLNLQSNRISPLVVYPVCPTTNATPLIAVMLRLPHTTPRTTYSVLDFDECLRRRVRNDGERNEREENGRSLTAVASLRVRERVGVFECFCSLNKWSDPQGRYSEYDETARQTSETRKETIYCRWACSLQRRP